MRTRSLAIIGPVLLLLVGCAGEEPSRPAAASTTQSESPGGVGGGDLTDTQVTCLDAGEVVVEAQVPPATEAPANGAATLDLDRRLLDALDRLDALHAMGDVAAGLDRVMGALGEMTAISAVQTNRGWADRRDDLTEAVIELQDACEAAGVPDFLNP